MMRAIQIAQTGGPEVLVLRELPKPVPGPGQALVKIEACGVNFIDVYLREGRYLAQLPFIPGQEGAGTVVVLGSGVTTVKVGDRVAWCHVTGSYAEFAAVPASMLILVPANISTRQAAGAMLQGMTAHYLSHSTYAIQPGDSLLIHAGAGGVGLLLIQMAKRLGARVFTTVSTDEKAALAQEAGADEVIFSRGRISRAESACLPMEMAFPWFTTRWAKPLSMAAWHVCGRAACWRCTEDRAERCRRST